jgi:hypothetical protein
MIITTRTGATAGEIESIRERFEAAGLRTPVWRGEARMAIGCIGDAAAGRHVMSPLPRAAAA